MYVAMSMTGLVNYVSFENLDVNIKFLHPEEPVTNFFWTNCQNVCCIPINDIICRVEPP